MPLVPTAGLNTDRVVTEAAELADEVGLDRLTLAALAARLGVRQPSLYKHVASLDALQRLISMRGKAELADVLGRAAIGRARDDALVAMAHAWRAWALEHPGDLPDRQPFGPVQPTDLCPVLHRYHPASSLARLEPGSREEGSKFGCHAWVSIHLPSTHPPGQQQRCHIHVA